MQQSCKKNLKRCASGNGTTSSTARTVPDVGYKTSFFTVLVKHQSSWPYPTFHTNESRLVYDIDANQEYEQLTREVCFISVITRHLLVTIEKRSHSTMRI